VIDDLPFSQASENNKTAILEVLTRHLGDKDSLLEIAGGTGQHAVFFASLFTYLAWQSSDIPSNVDSLNRRIVLAELENLPAAISVDVNDSPWNCDSYDVIFTANSLHIMSAGSVENLFGEVANHINARGLLCVYGPFKYGGEFTTESNANFDLWLKERDPVSGVRDFEWVNVLAESAGLRLLEDNAMPANNQLLIWEKLSG
jgi:cyclopropane fatty-acyl-phospholipid synthase-like methyltransferase